MNVTGTVNSNSIEGYVRSLNRVQQLCNPTQVATLTLSTAFPNAVEPGQGVVLYESGVLVFTVYVIKATRERPSYDWKVEAHDTYTRCTNLFIEDKLTVGYDPVTEEPLNGYTALSTDYWIAYLCGLAGVSHTSSGGTGTVPQGVQIGLRTVHESLTDVIAYSSQYVYANPSGVLKFERISKGATDFTLTDCITVEDTTSDEWTRNVVKVFGYAGTTSRILSVASQSVAGIDPDRVTAVGAPMIGTQAEADRVSSYLLRELGDITRIVTARIEGNPSIRIGKGARIVYGTTDYTDVITTVVHNTDENGYITEVNIGERCPRIAGWSKETPLIYAGTRSHGVYISRDGGKGWAEFNTGLPTGTKNVIRIGANSFEEAMAIVNGKLYYTDGETAWSQRTLPAPINSAEDVPAPGYGGYVAVDALGTLGAFAVLTTNAVTSGSTGSPSTGSPAEFRSWVYTCENTGSTPASWDSTQVVTQTSGSSYQVMGIDMKSTLGIPYVLGSSGSTYIISGLRYFVDVRSKERVLHYEDGFVNKCEAAPSNYGLVDWGGQFGLSGTVPVFFMQAYTYTGTYKDNVFLYGTGYPPSTTPGYDESGYRVWEYQYNFLWSPLNVMGDPPYLWTATIPLSDFPDVSDFQGMLMPFFYFNLFWSPHRTLNASCITIKEECGNDPPTLGIGESPYGDLYGPLGHGGPKDPATPYPILSRLLAGVFSTY
jgi:hypothetical protein